jgi:hypothetical protein
LSLHQEGCHTLGDILNVGPEVVGEFFRRRHTSYLCE